MKAEIITIGTEILIGQIVDTNSAWIGERLNEIGVEVHRITSISDDKEVIISTIDQALKDVDVVLITGGLGPTNDDITKKTLAEYFDCELVENKDCLRNVEEIFQRFNRPVTQVNREQALVPSCCFPIVNKAGTAPCMWFDHENKVVISMPGVPFEMKWLMNNDLLSRLKMKFKLPIIKHRTILTSGEGESSIAERLKDFESQLPENVSLAYLPSPGRVRLRLSVKEKDQELAIEAIKKFGDRLSELVSDLKYGEDLDKLESVVGELLRERGLTISTAESCTGGSIASKLVSISGSSDYFKGSVVSYWEEVKSSQLNVSPQLISDKGIVSEEVAVEMARGVKLMMGTDCAISTTGVAGPDGGTEENPVGKVCIATSFNGRMVVNTYYFAGSRTKIIERAAIAGLNQIRKMLIE